jgi:flagellar hook protein FlgE
VPSITDGLYAGRAGIQAFGTAISVVADNITNQGTTGFKSSRADFTDLLSGSIGGGGSGSSVGSGSQIAGVTPVLKQGTFEPTGRPLDLGIDGNGYFIVRNPANNQQFYTRSGSLSVDTQGNLIDLNGYRVLGFPANQAGGLASLNVNQFEVDNADTNGVSFTGNLNAESPVVAAPPVAAIGGGQSFADLSQASQFQSSVEVFDSLGARHVVTVFFYHTDPGDPAMGIPASWVAQAVVDGADAGGNAGEPIEVGRSTMEFSPTGQRSNPPVAPAPDFTAAPAWSNGSEVGDIDFSFDPFTQFAASSTIGSIDQNGTGSGTVVGFRVSEDGSLLAQLDNGAIAPIGTVALAKFANPERLDRVGSSLFTESSNSGVPVIGVPNTGTFGRLESGALEQSTTDLGSEFVKLISLQRGFQGSSRIISSIDELLNEIISLA